MLFNEPKAIAKKKLAHQKTLGTVSRMVILTAAEMSK